MLAKTVERKSFNIKLIFISDTMTDIEESSVVDEIIAAVIDFFQIVVRYLFFVSKFHK